ncbi:WD repeat-containing protein LWD1 [Vitis vinifera]|nr:WD repeat-containing protein LWD1 [Vitis vinifera]XP_010654118.1 WD repeat-containing protein LWD1 [Vitis vinifera]XP_059595148.1 WD repeat-containing protein LWD1 [Vitis vinifera]|eukprot:XP_002281909.1 PREDICTED: WD repeat-containing protein LWD1 [Vitis vinifera]
MQSPVEKKPGVYTYMAQWPIYSLAWSVRRDKKSRLAVGSFLEDYSNKVEVVQFSQETLDFSTDSRLVFDHPYAPTKLMFFPSEEAMNPDLIATSGDYLRLWEIHDDRIELKALLNGNKSEFNSAITSFDWAQLDARRIATCSVDTTCTIWDVERAAVDTQLVAHDKEVFDISWGGVGIFASVSGDGSARIFDLRDKERSTIIYENPIPDSPLLRLEWNKGDPKLIATVGMDSNKVVILDIRFPTTPILELRKHETSVNAISWAPHVGRHLCSVGDDSRALIWDVASHGFRLDATDEVEPIMWYGSTAEINQARWSPVDLDWIAIAFSNKLQLLKV